MDAKRPEDNPSMRQSKSALLEAAQAAVEDQKTKAQSAGTARPRGRGLGLRAFFLLVAMGGGTVLVIRPAWLVGAVPPPEPPAVRAASARLVLIGSIARIRSYADSTGHLPDPPSEAGIGDPAITVKPVDGSAFEVAIRVGDSIVAVRSTDSLKPLVAASIRALQQRLGAP